LLSNGKYGALRIDEAERLQVGRLHKEAVCVGGSD
jgi:hypothetical protein